MCEVVGGEFSKKGLESLGEQAVFSQGLFSHMVDSTRRRTLKQDRYERAFFIPIMSALFPLDQVDCTLDEVERSSVASSLSLGLKPP